MDTIVTSCRDSPENAYWNSATNTPDQSVIFARLALSQLFYVVTGAIASVFNMVCIVVFVTRKELRIKYLLFAVLAFANLINTLFLFLAGTVRRQMIFTNQYNQMRSTFECLLQPGPHLQLLGGQLPAVILLVIDVERFIAVYR
uniref:G-protein coupled receptors family 1 profile domain-containing protein n=1 Tax=Plectus sambesii TaxID=2011161 RepID=A0A914XQC7_9BILA